MDFNQCLRACVMIGCSVFNVGLRCEIEDKRPAGTTFRRGGQ